MDQARTDYDTLDDDALAAFVSARDDSPARTAYAVLFRRHERTLRRRAQQFAGNNRTVAEEAFSQTMTEAWVRRADYRPEDGTWLVWVTNRLTSRVTDEFRRQVRYPQEPEEHELSAFRDTRALTPEHIVTDRDELERALAALAAVNPQARDVLVLRYVDEFTVEEIADRTNVAVAVVYALIRTASEFLEGALARRGGLQT